jgi:hypothetical protein
MKTSCRAIIRIATVGWTWAEPYRGRAHQEVLASGRKFGVMDMIQLQHDELSYPRGRWFRSCATWRSRRSRRAA